MKWARAPWSSSNWSLLAVLLYKQVQKPHPRLGFVFFFPRGGEHYITSCEKIIKTKNEENIILARDDMLAPRLGDRLRCLATEILWLAPLPCCLGLRQTPNEEHDI